jgi:hypothetical protein
MNQIKGAIQMKRRFKFVFFVAAFFLGGLSIVQAKTVEASMLHRAYNPNTGEHLYTQNQNEIPFVVSHGWRDEGRAWEAPNNGKEVYRMFNPNFGGDHFYTLNANERDHLKKVGWKFEGVSWRSGGSIPVYRLYNPNAKSGSHHYTVLASERDHLKSVGWRDEGIGFYATNPSNATSSIKELEILKQNYTSLNGTWTNSHGYQITFNNGSIKLSGSEINGRTQFSLNNPIKANNVLFISFNPVPAPNGMQVMVALKGTSPSSGLIGSDGTNRDNDRIIMANNGGTSLFSPNKNGGLADTAYYKK